jgi:hypothetical protein
MRNLPRNAVALVDGKDFYGKHATGFAGRGAKCGELIESPSASNVARRKDRDEYGRRARVFQQDPEVIIAAKASVIEKTLEILRTAKAAPQLDFQILNELIDPTNANRIWLIIDMRIRHECVILEFLDVRHMGHPKMGQPQTTRAILVNAPCGCKPYMRSFSSFL